MNKYDLVLFDVDGTLLDTSEGIFSSMCYALEKHGIKVPKTLAPKDFIGPPMQDIFVKLFGMDKDRAMEIAAEYRAHYCTEDLLKAKAYDGIYKVIEYLNGKGIKYSVATYKRQDYAERIVKEFGFSDNAVSVIGADFLYKLTKKDIIEKCIEQAGVTDRKRVLMIGDTEYDAIGAKDAGANFLGVFYGFGFENYSDLEKVDSIGGAKTPLEIIDFLER